ncbi:EamA family transporter RarD [Neisseria leonii]|uniref:EamA family transporter RarD n=1 Tax=Neisseria leonii TaxID=2995413 RepID=UPI00237AD7CE|nr:EamA family transporter RarD [Neisseria sp. 3986]MDD9325957.1 EamA family transporter RarD [Neisseria sp. 3986]
MNAVRTAASREFRQGIWYAAGCYAVWGMFPIYWYPVNQAGMAADQVLAQRIVWSALFAGAVMLFTRNTAAFAAVARQPKLIAALMLSGLCIGMNWLVYLWAITGNHVLDASLGYFISPLFSVFLGRAVLKERLDKLQAAAVCLAFAGILWLAVPAGQVPWVALLLTFTFGLYGFIRKTAPVGALVGLMWETLVLLPFAAAYLVYHAVAGSLQFAQYGVVPSAVLIGSGVMTTLPLLMFAAGARRISLSVLGMMQYISPVLQLLAGLLLFGETFDTARLIGYGWVWLGVVLYLAAAWRQQRTA